MCQKQTLSLNVSRTLQSFIRENLAVNHAFNDFCNPATGDETRLKNKCLSFLISFKCLCRQATTRLTPNIEISSPNPFRLEKPSRKFKHNKKNSAQALRKCGQTTLLLNGTHTAVVHTKRSCCKNVDSVFLSLDDRKRELYWKTTVAFARPFKRPVAPLQRI